MLSINYTQIKHLSLVLKKQDLLPNASGEGAGLAWLTSAISSVPHNKLDVSKMSALVIPMEVYPNLAQLEALKKSSQMSDREMLTSKVLFPFLTITAPDY